MIIASSFFCPRDAGCTSFEIVGEIGDYGGEWFYGSMSVDMNSGGKRYEFYHVDDTGYNQPFEIARFGGEDTLCIGGLMSFEEKRRFVEESGFVKRVF